MASRNESIGDLGTSIGHALNQLWAQFMDNYHLPLSSTGWTNVDPGSPAAQAGLRDGDIIVSFAGESVSGIDELHRLLSTDRVGKDQPLLTLRGIHLVDTTVTPAHRPE